jgi:inhibitor of KinA sporulation pathway (predicted exonuclease)
MIDRQCRAFGLESPFKPSHFNIKTLFKSVYPGSKGGYGMKTAFKRIMARNIEGTHHRGGDDAKNIASVIFSFVMLV